MKERRLYVGLMRVTGDTCCVVEFEIFVVFDELLLIKEILSLSPENYYFMWHCSKISDNIFNGEIPIFCFHTEFKITLKD